MEAAEGVIIEPIEGDGWYAWGRVTLQIPLDPAEFLHPGCSLVGDAGLPTFTTSRPRSTPGPRPAGLWQCSQDEKDRWTRDQFRFPPYQYRDKHLIRQADGEMRMPTISEKEVIMGFPLDYTVPCRPKSLQVGHQYQDARHTLIRNTWNVSVVAWLMSNLFCRLGLSKVKGVSHVVKQTSPGQGTNLRTYLQRLPIRRIQSPSMPGDPGGLAKKLASFVSIKGEDILLQMASEKTLRYQRLRASVPAKLWRWKVVAGWAWKHGKAHINELELRAVLTCLSWRLQRRRQRNCRFIHLVDSLVVLHCLSRGRSSSRKLRRVLSQINALVLRADVHPVWAYVSTKQNPADRPSRKVQNHAKKKSKA